MVPHRTRVEHHGCHPAHVTLRARPGARSLRQQKLLATFLAIFARPNVEHFQIVHFSIQSNHVHLIVEAKDKDAFSSGMRSFAIRVARRLNRLFGRKGAFWIDRYYRRDLYTRRQVRRALVYVLQNHKKHGLVEASWLRPDPLSSGVTFDGWAPSPPRLDPLLKGIPPARRPPLPAPKTGLLRLQWRKLGLVRLDEVPSGAPAA